MGFDAFVDRYHDHKTRDANACVNLGVDRRLDSLPDPSLAEVAALFGELGEPGQRFYIAGRPHVRSQAYHLMVGDMATLVPVAVAIAALTTLRPRPWVSWLAAATLAQLLTSKPSLTSS